ncbi:hypothetical protein [Methylobacterium platani]|uniref:Uncharacterized protein n=2 Tax=Methylobacterium platani TaxID=427683 RepID=A0A179S219_9HYPH|nr:hypothetical protein [Methylobacterium platani]KMO10717.1 hypothetical protein SQ03_29255 [Methylobacterium platani JCM 14648]OAS19757.1 hypothetical protein A5481_24295 [Methylobacterium platani]
MPMSDGVFDRGGWPRACRGGASPGSVSAQRLRRIEALLGVPLDPLSAAGPAEGEGGDDRMEIERQAIELLRAFGRITDPAARHEVLRLVRAAARPDRL